MRTRSMAVALAMLLATQAALAATRPPAPAKAGIRPVVFADQVARVTVGRGTALLDTTIDYTVRQGQLRDLALALPAEATVRLVQGDGLRTWAVTTEDGQRVLRVLLAEPAAGRYQLWLRVEQAFPRGAIGQPVALTLPAVAPLDVERETGVVAVLTRTGVEVEAGQMKGAATLKPAELPAAFAEIKDKVRLAYRLVKRPCVVEVQATEVEAETLLTGPVTLEAPRLLLNEATGTGAVGDTVAKVTLNVAFEAVGRGTSEALLLPPDVALTDYRFTGGRGAKIIRDATGYLLRAAAAGEGSVEVQYVVVVEKKEKIRSLALPLVPAAKASTALTIPGEAVKVSLSPQVSYETTTSPKGTVLTLFGAAREQVKVSWEPKVELKEVEAVVFADQNARITVGRGVLRVETVLDYTVLQGKVKELAVALPADATLLSVKGEGIRSWDVTGQGAQRALKVLLLDEVSDRYQLELQVEQAIGKGDLAQAAAFAVPAIAAMNVERETGAVGILVWKGLKVEPTKTEGVTQVDVREMPAAFQKLKEQVHLAYRYLQRPFSIEAQVSEVEAKVSAEVLTAVRVSPEALRFSSRIEYTIKDAGVFRFQIKLGKDVKLVDLQGENINNWERQAEVLAIDLRSKAEGAYGLTLETEQAIPQGTAEIDVAAVELLEVARERGHLALSAYPGIKVEPVKATDIMQIDVRDLPKTKANPAPAPDLAFRYLKHPYTLRIAISKVKAEVAATVHTAMKVSEKTIEVNATVQYDIRKAGIFGLQVALPADFRLLGCDGPNIDDWKVADGTLTVALKQKTEGSYTLTLTGKHDVAKLDALPLPVFRVKEAEKETGFIAVRADESLRVKTATIDKLAEIDVKELPKELQKDKVLLAYRYFVKDWSGTIAAESIEPHVTAETFTFLSLGEAQLQVSVTVRYTILYAGIQTLRIQLPDGVAAVDITGEDIKHREEDKAKHIWTIALQAKKKGDYRLFVTFQQELAGESIDLKYQGVTVGDPTKGEKDRLVKRETGYIAVAARSDLELAGGSELKGLTPIDPQEIPSDYKVGISVPLLLAFRYLRHPYTLHATAAKHDPADVLVAIIEGCLLSTTLTQDGNLITDLTCRLRNTREQNLAMALPEGAELWHVFVDGKRVIPVQSEESGTVWTKVPIAGVGDALRAFVVQLRFGHTIEPLGGHGVLALDYPRLSIPAMRLGWRVSLPEKYRLVRHGGSLRFTDYLDRELAGLTSVVAPVAGQQAPVNAPQVQAPAQGDQAVGHRFQQMRLNAWNAENLRQVAGSIKGGRAGGQRSIYTGTKPETANVYHFQSLIAMKDAGSIRSTYLRTSVDHVLQGVLVLAALVAVAAFWTLCRQLSRSWRLAVLIAAVLVVLGVRTLSEEAYRQHMTDVLWTLAAMSGVMLVWDGVRALRPRKPQPPVEKEKEAPPPEQPPAAEPADPPPPEEPEEPEEG